MRRASDGEGNILSIRLSVCCRLAAEPAADIQAGGDDFVRGGAVPAFTPATRAVGIDPGQKNVVFGAVMTMGELPWLRDRLQFPVSSLEDSRLLTATSVHSGCVF